MADTTIPEIELAINEAKLYADVIMYMVKRDVSAKDLFDRVNKLTTQSDAKIKALQEKYGDDANRYIQSLSSHYSSMRTTISLAAYANNTKGK